jgi:hypothetical protein
MKRILFIVLFVSQLTVANNIFWGKTGHRVVGEVATQHLTGKTKRALKKLLNGESLAMVSTYADEIKADNRYRKYNPWHYVNIDAGTPYSKEKAYKGGDIIQAIEHCIMQIKSTTSSKTDKVFFLKLLVHFIGDLHQPLHVGKAKDKGGNDFQVRWFNNGSNLHRVWDTDMINHYGMSYTELANNLPNLTKNQIQELKEGTVLDWVYESQELANKVYASANTGEKLGYEYMYQHFNTIKEQLQKGGIRLAKVLNEVFK